MRTSANLKRVGVPMVMGGLVLLAGFIATIAARAQDATPRGDSRTPTSREDAANARAAKFQEDMQRQLANSVPKDSEESCALALAKLTKDAVGNVSFCATTFLSDASKADVENYRLCASLASDLLAAQIKKCENANVNEITDAVRLVSVWANVELRFASPVSEDGVAGLASQILFADRVKDAIANISFCATTFLGHRSEPNSDNLEGYRICAGGASELFSKQIKKDSQATVVQTSEAKRLIAVWTDVEMRVASNADDGGVAGLAQQQVFADCIADYKANVDYCKKEFIGDLPGLAQCIDFAVQMAENCLLK